MSHNSADVVYIASEAWNHSKLRMMEAGPPLPSMPFSACIGTTWRLTLPLSYAEHTIHHQAGSRTLTGCLCMEDSQRARVVLQVRRVYTGGWRTATQVMPRTMEGWEDLQCFGWNSIIWLLSIQVPSGHVLMFYLFSRKQNTEHRSWMCTNSALFSSCPGFGSASIAAFLTEAFNFFCSPFRKNQDITGVADWTSCKKRILWGNLRNSHALTL
jgi:hypothetical protein